MPPIAHRLAADVDTTFEHDVFDLAQRQRIADVHHHRETDDLGRAIKITKGIVHYHRLREVPFQLNPIFSDNALSATGRVSQGGLTQSKEPPVNPGRFDLRLRNCLSHIEQRAAVQRPILARRSA